MSTTAYTTRELLAALLRDELRNSELFYSVIGGCRKRLSVEVTELTDAVSVEQYMYSKRLDLCFNIKRVLGSKSRRYGELKPISDHTDYEIGVFTVGNSVNVDDEKHNLRDRGVTFVQEVFYNNGSAAVEKSVRDLDLKRGNVRIYYTAVTVTVLTERSG